jgi:hypothetical protein
MSWRCYYRASLDICCCSGLSSLCLMHLAFCICFSVCWLIFVLLRVGMYVCMYVRLSVCLSDHGFVFCVYATCCSFLFVLSVPCGSSCACTFLNSWHAGELVFPLQFIVINGQSCGGVRRMLFSVASQVGALCRGDANTAIRRADDGSVVADLYFQNTTRRDKFYSRMSGEMIRSFSCRTEKRVLPACSRDDAIDCVLDESYVCGAKSIPESALRSVGDEDASSATSCSAAHPYDMVHQSIENLEHLRRSNTRLRECHLRDKALCKGAFTELATSTDNLIGMSGYLHDVSGSISLLYVCMICVTCSNLMECTCGIETGRRFVSCPRTFRLVQGRRDGSGYGWMCMCGRQQLSLWSSRTGGRISRAMAGRVQLFVPSWMCGMPMFS